MSPPSISIQEAHVSLISHIFSQLAIQSNPESLLKSPYSTTTISASFHTATMTFQSQKQLQNSGFMASDAAKKYENAENATLPFAKILIEKSRLAQLGDGEASILDLACGTGAVIKELYEAVPKEMWEGLKVLGADVSPPMLEYLVARGKAQGWPNLETKIIDGSVRIPLSIFPSSLANVFLL
jgi:SAM-dependent methyltransferase